MRWIALFSGQGGQRIEHARQLPARASPQLLDAWRDALAGAPVDEDSLTRNRVAQPTLAAWQVASFATIAAELPPPVLIAGYSVGEIAAACAAGGYAAPDAIRLAAARARLMDEAMPVPAGLAAVLGLDERTLTSLCDGAGAAIAIRNGFRHFVIGGPASAVQSVVADAVTAGATRAQLLPVGTPAHTHFLGAAVAPFAAVLQPLVRGPLGVPMISGIDAARLRTAHETVSALSRQLATRLDWAGCMDAVVEAQADAVLEIGPGNALARMLAEAAPDVRVRALDDFRDPAAAVAWVLHQGSGTRLA